MTYFFAFLSAVGAALAGIEGLPVLTAFSLLAFLLFCSVEPKKDTRP